MATNEQIENTFCSLLDCAKAFHENESGRLSTEAIKEELSRIANDAAYLEEIASTLIPSDMHIDADYVQRFSEFAHSIAGFVKREVFLAPLLKAILCQLPEPKRMKFLTALIEESNIHFWSYAIVLQDVVPFIPLSAAFLAEWLLALAKKEGNDMAGGNAYAIAFAYSRQNPETVIQLIEIYLAETFDRTKAIIIQEALGGLRLAENLSEALYIRLQNIEQKLSANPLVDWRICSHRSWAATLTNQDFDKGALLEKLSMMMAGEPEEQTAAFYTMRRWIIHFMRTENADVATSVFVAWHLEHAKASLPDLTKHEVAASIESYTLLRHDKIVQEKTASALIKIAKQILPIAQENKGTWCYLLEFTARIAQSALPDQWVDFWKHLAAQDAKSILIENLDHNSEATFWYCIEQAKTDEIITRILFHKNGSVRQYGQAFFAKFKQVTIDNAFLDSLSDKRFLLGLLDFTRKCYTDTLLPPFILGIASRLESVVDAQVKERCLFEIRLLIINYSGTLMEAVKQATAQHPILTEPVQAAKQYHEAIRQWQDSPVNNILRHELIGAAHTAQRKFNAQVRESGYKDSLMALICSKPSTVIYGNAFTTVQNGGIADPQHFRCFSHSFELPHLPIVDPEGDRWRNMQLYREIEALENDES